MSIEQQIKNIDKAIETAVWLSNWDRVEELESKRRELIEIRDGLKDMTF